MADKDFEKQLGDFVNGDPKEQHNAFRKLIAARKHNEAAKDKRFSAGLERLYQAAGDRTLNELDRLLSLATIGRIASTIKAQKKEIYGRLTELLVDPLSSQQLLDDVDDRAYIGKLCTAVLPPWTAPYAARAVVVEDTGEQVRQAFMLALFKASPDLDSAIETLIAHLQEFAPATEEPGNSMAVKLRRIFAALRAAMAEAMPEPGENPGRSLAKLIKAAFAGVASPTKQENVLAAAEDVAGTVHEMVRLRFSLATEAATYHSLLQIKELVPVHAWEKFAKDSTFLSMVATDITEALLILGRQGIIDSSLAERLVTALGNRNRAKTRLATLAKQPGLSPEVKIWLAEGRTRAVVDGEAKRGESQLLSDDVQLADLLVDAQRFRGAEGVSRHHVLPEIGILNPGVVSEIERLLNYGLGLCDAINSLANLRGLRVRGNPGEVEDYAPLEHELIDGGGGARRVRLIRPAVEQLRSNGVPFVLRKGIVESVK